MYQKYQTNNKSKTKKQIILLKSQNKANIKRFPFKILQKKLLNGTPFFLHNSWVSILL